MYHFFYYKLTMDEHEDKQTLQLVLHLIFALVSLCIGLAIVALAQGSPLAWHCGNSN